MALPPISPHLKSSITRKLAVMAQGIPLKLAFLLCAHSEDGQCQQSVSSLISRPPLFFGEVVFLLFFTSIACVNIIGVYSYVVVLFRPHPVSREQLVL